MKKKFIAMLLCLAMALTLAACGGNSGGALNANSGGGAASGGTTGGGEDLPAVTWKMGSTWGAGNVHFSVDQRFTEILRLHALFVLPCG